MAAATVLISGLTDSNVFEIGEPVTIPLVVQVAGVQTDATTVQVRIRTPDGVSTSYTLAGAQVVRDATGIYHYTFTPTLAMRHAYTWTTTVPAGVASGEWWVIPTSAP